MAVGLATRVWAVEFGGNAVFSDLKPGDRFHFPGTPDRVFVKLRGGWFRGFFGSLGLSESAFRTGKGTAVVKR